MSPRPPVPFFEHARNVASPNAWSPSPDDRRPARHHDDARRERGACISCRSSERTRMRDRGRSVAGGGRERTRCPLARQRRRERAVELPFTAHAGSRTAHYSGCGRAGRVSFAIPVLVPTEPRRSRPYRASSETCQFVTCGPLAIAQVDTCDAPRSRSSPVVQEGVADHRLQGATP